MPACFGHDFNAALDRAAELDVATIGAEFDARDHLRDGIDRAQNIAQPDDLRTLDHSKNLDRFSFDLGSQLGMKSFAGGEVRRTAKDRGELRAQADQLYKAETVGIVID